MATEKPDICPNCGNRCAIEDVNCPNCGKNLDELFEQIDLEDLPNSPSSNAMKFSFADLEQWAEKELITPEQLTKIRSYVEASGSTDKQSQAGPEQRKGLNFVSIAYYFGAFMILLAYTVFMGLQWESLGLNGQIMASFLTIAALWAIGYFLHRKGFQSAGGLLIFAGTGIVPLLVYSVQRAVGLWDNSGYVYRDFYQVVAKTWLILEVVSLSVAIIVIWRSRFPLITLLIAFWTWYLSMDITRLISKSNSFWEWGETIQIVSTLIGLGMLALGVLLQRNSKRDYSLWFYLFGHIIILGHLSSLTIYKQGGLGLIYIGTYLAFVVASVWLQRRVFLVFGAIGCYGYVSYLAFQVFDGALGFVLALGSIGLLMVLTAVGYQKYVRHWLEQQIGKYRLSNS